MGEIDDGACSGEQKDAPEPRGSEGAIFVGEALTPVVDATQNWRKWAHLNFLKDEKDVVPEPQGSEGEFTLGGHEAAAFVGEALTALAPVIGDPLNWRKSESPGNRVLEGIREAMRILEEKGKTIDSLVSAASNRSFKVRWHAPDMPEKEVPPELDKERFPHACVHCGKPSYNGLIFVDCSNSACPAHQP